MRIVRFFVVSIACLFIRTKITSTFISEVHGTLATTLCHITLTVVHPAKSSSKNKSDDDNSSGETTNILLDFSTAIFTIGVISGSSRNELSSRLGLADSTCDTSVDVSFVDPAALVVVGSLEAFSLSSGIAERTDTETISIVPSAEVGGLLVGTRRFSGECGAFVLSTFRTSPDAAFNRSAEFFLRGSTFALGTSRQESVVPLAALVLRTSVLFSDLETFRRLALAISIIPHAVIIVFDTNFNRSEAAETRNADTTFHSTEVVSDTRFFIRAVLVTTR